MRETPVSICEKKFILQAASEFKRLDGRKLEEFRKLQIQFGNSWGSCFTSIGETKVLAQVTCEIQQPKATRPNEGLLYVNVELSPMAAPSFEQGRGSELGVHLNRLLEKCLKDSRAVDLESLCVVSEEKVWVLRVDVNVLNHEGNLADCCSIAALAALAHFRRPDVTTDGQDITVHDVTARDPIPITLHHYPVCVSFAFLNEGGSILADPTAIEERVSDASLVFGVNSYRELCGLHLGGSALANPQLVMKCSGKAAERARDVVLAIKEALAADSAARLSDETVGFANSLELTKLASISQEFLKIKLRKFAMSNNEEMDHGDNNITEEVKDPEDKSSEEIKDADVDNMQGDGDARIVDLGENCAELIPLITRTEKLNNDGVVMLPAEQYGAGGSTKWEGVVEKVNIEHSDDEDEVMEVPVSKGVKNVESIELSSDSEEEITFELNPEEINEGVSKKRKNLNKSSVSSVKTTERKRSRERNKKKKRKNTMLSYK